MSFQYTYSHHYCKKKYILLMSSNFFHVFFFSINIKCTHNTHKHTESFVWFSLFFPFHLFHLSQAYSSRPYIFPFVYKMFILSHVGVSFLYSQIAFFLSLPYLFFMLLHVFFKLLPTKKPHFFVLILWNYIDRYI